MKLKLKAKLIIILVFSSICSIIFFSSNDVQALTQEEAGEYIAEFAINFHKDHASETIYSLTGWEDNTNSHRAYAYRGQKVSGTASVSNNMASNGMKPMSFTDKYGMDCVGWVSFCIHHSLGLGDANTFTMWVTPQNGAVAGNGFYQVTDGSKKPGDILATSGHVAVYIGNGEVIDSAGVGESRNISRRATAGKYSRTFRISEEKAAQINKSDATTIFNGSGSVTNKWSDSSSSSSSSEATQNGRIVDTDDKLPLFKHILLTEKYNFNNIKWKTYGHGYDGQDSEMQEDLNLGLKYPKDSSNTPLNDFIDFTLPYLQNWMIPLGMNSGVNAKGNTEEVANNPLFTYSTIRKAMSDIIVNRYDITTCELTTKYRYYDIIKVTETRTIRTNNNFNSSNTFTGFLDENSLEVNEEVVQSGVTEPEEVVSKQTTIEPEYYVKQAWTFDNKITNNFNYIKFSDSDVENLVENGVGFCGRSPEKDGETINEIYDRSTSFQNGKAVTTYYKKVGKYKYLTRTWRDEIKPEEAKNDSYTYEDVLNYNKGTNTSTTSEGVSYSFDGTIYNCEKYDLSEEKIKTLAKKVASEDDGSLEGQAAMISQMINRYEYAGKSQYSDVVDYVYNSSWYASNNANQPTEETYALIRSIICEGKRTLPPYVTEMDGIAEMKHWFSKMVRYLSIEGYPNPERGKSKVLGSYGAEGTYWCHFDYGGEGNVFYYDEDYKNKCTENNIEVSEEKIENLVSNTTSSNSSISSTTQVESLEGFLFIGDSLTVGLKSSNCLSEATVMGVGGASAANWNIYLNGGSPGLNFSHISLPDSAKGVSVTLGINSLNVLKGKSGSGLVESTLSQTKILLTKLEEKYPNTPIYVQRVFPMCTSKANSYDVTKTNQVVSEYNEKMKAYCSEKGYIYIDATSGLIDSEGSLDSTITSDGIHFTSSGYSAWEKNIRASITSGGTSTSSNSNADSVEFTDIDKKYYNQLEIDNEINKVDLMNSKPSEYLEYLSKGTEYSNHVGYTRAYLTFSYSALKRLFSDYFNETNEVPFAYGSSLGYKTFTASNSLKASKYNSDSGTSSSGQVGGKIAGIGDLTGTGIEVGTALSSASYTNAMKYFDIAKKYAEMFGLDPYLVVAIIATESSGNPNASSGPAIGLMQWEKTNGQSVNMSKADGTKEKLTFTFDQLRSDPDLQIKVGCAELKNQLDRFEGNVLVALQGYNYGAGGVKRCICHYISGGNGSGTYFGVTDEKYKEYIRSNDTGWLSSTSWYTSTGHKAFKGAGGGDSKYVSHILRFYNQEEAQKLN